MAKRITVFSAKRNADITEGRGPMVLIGYFSCQQDAYAAAAGWGVMGVGNGEVEKETLIIYETYHEFQIESDHALKQKALSKLSREERRILGL